VNTVFLPYEERVLRDRVDGGLDPVAQLLPAQLLLLDDVLGGGAQTAGIPAAVFVKLGLVLAVFMELSHRGRAFLLPTLVVIGLLLVGLGFAF
jgi:hypothetical protein